jgi:hypothetical protein
MNQLSPEHVVFSPFLAPACDGEGGRKSETGFSPPREVREAVLWITWRGRIGGVGEARIASLVWRKFGWGYYSQFSNSCRLHKQKKIFTND